uniref:Metal dependent phosphohydrolase n=1 Tax=Marseillevirus LCMAC101 TaxID=2506602 RepID=A0A481YSE3_9VIRU|nr:MAG: metal dependent phosphohydrolase [Marseillevirus LCMAC101]
MNSDIIVTKTILALDELISSHKVDKGHGTDHARDVLNHVNNALSVSNTPSDDTARLAIRLAALLHDADDRKFFDSKNYENARFILDRVIPEKKKIKQLVLKMIKLVSYTENGNSKDSSCLKEDWLLYPRYADRLEAIGAVGIERCYIYNLYIGRSLYLETTPRATTKEELSRIATTERYENYLNKKTTEDTLINHIYDKVLHIADHIIESGNPYFVKEARERHGVIVDFVLDFGIKGEVDMQKLNMLRWKRFKQAKKKN